MPHYKPYTNAGIKRVPCARCGAPSKYQWNICANNLNGRAIYQGICVRCDVALNSMVLRFMRDPQRAIKMHQYRQRA